MLYRSVGFTGDAAAAVHYALHYLGDLVETEGDGKRSGRISDDEVLHPRLQLPDVFELLHHSNQVTPMFILESVVGKSDRITQYLSCASKMLKDFDEQLYNGYRR